MTCNILCLLYTIPTSFRHRFFVKMFLINVSWTCSCLTKYCQSLFTDSATWLLDLQNKVKTKFTSCSHLQETAIPYILTKRRRNAGAKLQLFKHCTRPIWKHTGTIFLTNLRMRGGAKGRRKRTCSIFTSFLGTSEKSLFKRLHNNEVSI